MSMPALQEHIGRAGSEATVGELVAAAAGSDADAWQALTERFRPMVSSIARAYGLGSADSADVGQTVWLRLVDHIGRLHDPDRLAGWLAVTTRNECARVSGQRRRTTPTADLEAFRAGAGAGSDADLDPGTAVGRRERDAAVRTVLDSLPARSQALLRMLTSDPPASYGEVAAGLGIPVGSVGPTRQRCLRSLRAKCVLAGIEP